ncbi:MAG: class I SAM-dependent methyltransferase [Magnetococcales bacterium]|nr:class I SAM-dependent methyltransferase [Magnetococcales bacterium]
MTSDSRSGLIGRCVDCGRDGMAVSAQGWSCAACGREYRRDALGVLLAMPTQQSAEPRFYQNRDYQAWQKIWGTVADDWFIYRNALYRFFSMSGHRRVHRLLKEAGDVVHVELGCGPGQLFELVDGSRTIALDANLSFLHRLKKRYPSVMAVQGNLYNTPFLSGAVRSVLCLHTLEHLYHLAEALEEIERLMHAEGAMLFTLPTEGGWGWSLGRRLITVPELRRKHDLDALAIMEVEHINDAPRVMRFLKFYFTLQGVEYFPLRFLPWLGVNASITGRALPKKS